MLLLKQFRNLKRRYFAKQQITSFYRLGMSMTDFLEDQQVLRMVIEEQPRLHEVC